MPKMIYIGVNEAVEDLVFAESLNLLSIQIFNKLWGILTVILYYLGLYIVKVIYRVIKQSSKAGYKYSI